MNSIAEGYGTANPDPFGLYAFATTTMLFSLYNARAEGITNSNLVRFDGFYVSNILLVLTINLQIIGMALATGGLGQVLAGVWAVGTFRTSLTWCSELMGTIILFSLRKM